MTEAINFLKEHLKKSKFQRGEKAWNFFVNLRRNTEENIEEFVLKFEQFDLNLKCVGIKINSFV